MTVLSTPTAISDFTRALLHSTISPVYFHLQPRQEELTVTAYGHFRSTQTALIACPQFAAHLLPTLRAAFFRAQAQGQHLTCDVRWLRYQVHANLLTENTDYYFAHELDLLDRDATLVHDSSACAVLTFGAQHVHVHGAPNRQQAEQGDYVQKPFVSRLWTTPALALLQNELRWNGTLTESWCTLP